MSIAEYERGVARRLDKQLERTRAAGESVMLDWGQWAGIAFIVLFAAMVMKG